METDNKKLPEGIKETTTNKGIYFLGKDNGVNTYFDTTETMGTAGEPKDHINFLGDIIQGRINNPHGIMSVEYALSSDSYLPPEIKEKIKALIVYLRA